MTLREAAEAFIEHAKQEAASCNRFIDIGAHLRAIESLKSYSSATGAKSLDHLTPECVRDLVARWWVEESSRLQQMESQPPGRPQSEANAARNFLYALSDFFKWLDEREGVQAITECLPVIEELKESLPLAFEIKESLAEHIAARGGLFSFPEFLTSFEEGGHSEHDTLSLEGYFRIARVEGRLIEAEELISEERVWPIVFPEASASLIKPGYIMELEIVRAENVWKIAGSGLVYPPGAAVV
ncbi:MAG: hypothetical protein L0229_29050 [Blastocatellia bacterium]|nr:hypothetical protein [Blastocatellia bacterium]